MKHITHCPHCGKQLEPEVKRPNGCVCKSEEWADPYNLPPVCDGFEGDTKQICNRCEHDYECHAKAPG